MNEPFAPGWSVAAVRRQVVRSLGPAGPAHGSGHLLRVEKTALRFADPACDPPIVSLIALLHDAGRREALTRKAADVAFLEALFREQDAPEWARLLDEVHVIHDE